MLRESETPGMEYPGCNEVIKRRTPCCGLLTTPISIPSLGQEPTRPSGEFPLTWSQADYVLITPSEEWVHELVVVVVGSRRLTPQACRLPRPQHGANESNGNGWEHTGGQGLQRRGRQEPEKVT